MLNLIASLFLRDIDVGLRALIIAAAIVIVASIVAIGCAFAAQVCNTHCYWVGGQQYCTTTCYDQ